MPRVNFVQKARKDQGQCGRCGEPLPKGSPYRHWSFRYGGKHKRCMNEKCRPRGSELTQAKWGEALAAIEDAQAHLAELDTVDALLDGVQGIIDEAVERIEAVADEYEEAADAMGDAGELNQERSDCAHEAVDALQGFYPMEREDHEDLDDEEFFEQFIEEVHSALSEAEDAISSMP